MSTLKQDLNFKPEINVTGTGNGHDWEVSTDKDKFELSLGTTDQTVTITAGCEIDGFLIFRSIADAASLAANQIYEKLGREETPDLPSKSNVIPIGGDACTE